MQRVINIVATLLKGIGQIMLQDNAWTGLFFAVGIFLGSFHMGIAVLLAVVSGTITAKLLKYNDEEIKSGLYGFSAALVGVALLCFYQPTPTTWIAVVIGSALACILQHFFIVKKIPAFTFPFILITWLFFSIAPYFPEQILPQTAVGSQNVNSYLSLISHGMGQVIFQDYIWAGILFLIGVTVSRPTVAAYAILGIILSSILAYWLRESINDIYLGLLSYNAVLCAIVFAGNKTENFIKAFSSIILSVLLMVLMRKLNLPALTFPFVLATWLTMFTESFISKHIKMKQPQVG